MEARAKVRSTIISVHLRSPAEVRLLLVAERTMSRQSRNLRWQNRRIRRGKTIELCHSCQAEKAEAELAMCNQSLHCSSLFPAVRRGTVEQSRCRGCWNPAYFATSPLNAFSSLDYCSSSVRERSLTNCYSALFCIDVCSLSPIFPQSLSKS